MLDQILLKIFLGAGGEDGRTVLRAEIASSQTQTAGAFYHGLRLVSVDGSTLEVADEAGNREAFGVPGTNQGKTGYPQIRCVGLLENGTHAALGGYSV